MPALFATAMAGITGARTGQPEAAEFILVPPLVGLEQFIDASAFTPSLERDLRLNDLAVNLRLGLVAAAIRHHSFATAGLTCP